MTTLVAVFIIWLCLFIPTWVFICVGSAVKAYEEHKQIKEWELSRNSSLP